MPLCAIHHHQFHTTGKEREWWEERKVDPLVAASRLWRESRERSSGNPSIGRALRLESTAQKQASLTTNWSISDWVGPTAAQITSHRTCDNGTRPRNSCLFPGDGTVLIANVLTVAFVYCFAKVHQKELKERSKAASPICG